MIQITVTDMRFIQLLQTCDSDSCNRPVFQTNANRHVIQTAVTDL